MSNNAASATPNQPWSGFTVIDERGKDDLTLLREVIAKGWVSVVVRPEPNKENNLSEDEIRQLFANFPSRLSSGLTFQQEPRINSTDMYHAFGRNFVFKIEYVRTRMGRTQRFYIKGFYVEQQALCGVRIQSARKT